ncbi:hypothetical protein V2J09_013651, partial [Rumex salicifolius]
CCLTLLSWRTTIIDHRGLHRFYNHLKHKPKGFNHGELIFFTEITFLCSHDNGSVHADRIITLAKATLMSGFSQYAYMVYYQALGTISSYHGFGKILPLNFSLLCRFFGLKPNRELLVSNSYTVTIGASIGNLVPIFTFLIAICLRMERLDLRNFTDQIKALGILVAVLGAFVDVTAKIYPDEVTIVFFCNLFGTIQSVIVSFFMVKGTSKWQFNYSVEINVIAFSLCVVISTLLTWCLRKKGPVFVSMFDPLNVALAAFMGFVFPADGIYLGSC